MKFNISGEHFEVSDELIEEYLRRTPTPREMLDLVLENRLKTIHYDRESFSPDINKAVEEALRAELELWE